jgi:hypothetical protein
VDDQARYGRDGMAENAVGAEGVANADPSPPSWLPVHACWVTQYEVAYIYRTLTNRYTPDESKLAQGVFKWKDSPLH